MNKELIAALDALEKERDIKKENMLQAITGALVSAYEKYYDAKNVDVKIDPQTGDITMLQTKEVIEDGDPYMDPVLEISLSAAKEEYPDAKVGDVLGFNLSANDYSRIATFNAKSIITQSVREEERNIIYRQFSSRKDDIITGIVQRKNNSGWSINLGKADALLPEKEIVPTERLRPNLRLKVYVVNVENANKGAKITVSRTHPNLVKRLFEEEVTEIREGVVEIKSIAREAGSRTKIAVSSNNPNVDPVGACVGVNGARVNAIVEELFGEKIDIVNWDEDESELIKNALSPARISNVFAFVEEVEVDEGDGKGIQVKEVRTAKVVVPDDQLSLAIGKAGQNARLAYKLTGFKIDIKSETQAKDAEGFRVEDYYDDDDEYYDEEEGYEESGYIEEEYREDGNIDTVADDLETSADGNTGDGDTDGE